MVIAVGDTVKVLRHRNAFGEDISTWRDFPFKTGDTFVVGKIEPPDGYPCCEVFPVGEDSEFWREDDLEVIERVAPTDRVREIREHYGVGLLEARAMALKEQLLADIDAAQSIEDLRSTLRRVVNL